MRRRNVMPSTIITPSTIFIIFFVWLPTTLLAEEMEPSPASLETKSAYETNSSEVNALEKKIVGLDLAAEEPQSVPEEKTTKNISKVQEATQDDLVAQGTKTLMTLFLMIGGLLFIAWYVRRNGAQVLGKSTQIQIKSVLSLGNKEKVALIQVRGKEILIGVTSAHIQKIYAFDAEGNDLEDSDKEKSFEFRKILDKVEINNAKGKGMVQTSNKDSDSSDGFH